MATGSLISLSTMSRARRVRTMLHEFVAEEISGGIVLLVAAVAGMLWINLHGSSYHDVWDGKLTVGGGALRISESGRGWVNEVLMTLFFFLVGLEIKREIVVGELRDRGAAALPIIAAVGGMIVPAAIFLAVSAGTDSAHAWGVPVATDIAFVLGVLALVGRRAPAGLKLFLLALAIVDDLGGMVVIALFYADGLSPRYLAAAAVVVVAIVSMRRHVAAIPAYVVAGAGLWYLVYRSGVHPTVAGVAMGMLTPAVPVRGRDVLGLIERRLLAWSAFVVVPLFALANAGVEISTSQLRAAFTSRVVWGVMLGLVVGKALGISAFALGAVRLGWARLPPGVRPRDLVGGAALGGIGFTVALFIAGLSLGGDPSTLARVKLGVLTASLLAALLGSAILVVSRGGRAIPRRRGAGRRRCDGRRGQGHAASGG